jgi:hypothetical protein
LQALAVIELGMSPKKFWKLSFYEWSLYALRIRSLINKRKFDHELMIRLSRRMMFVNARVMGSKKGKESDFWELDSDKVDENLITEEEFHMKIENIAKKRKKKIINKKNG